MASAPEQTLKRILVTGGNSGIGAALCKLLVTEHSCFCYLGSRDTAKGEAAVKQIVDAFPAVGDRIQMLRIDVNDEATIAAAAEFLQAEGVKLYALVNNAGVGLATEGSGGARTIVDTNYLGAKRVTAAFVSLIDPVEGRIVNVSSGAASMWLRRQDEATKTLFSNPDVTQEQLDAAVNSFLSGDFAYGLSKAALTAMTMIHAKAYPNLKVTSLSPGFIDVRFPTL